MRRMLLVGLLSLIVTLVWFLFPGTAFAENWSQVGSGGIDGNYDYASTAYCTTVFDSCLYAGAAHTDGCYVWRFDGSSWTKACDAGFGDPANSEVSSLAEYGGDLYAGTYKNTGGEVWRYDGPGPSDWTMVSSGGFGDSNNRRIQELAEYGGYLYAGTSNTSTGCELWRTQAAGGPPYSDWVQVNSDGFGTASNQGIFSMLEYSGHLHVGTYNSSTSCQIWTTLGIGGPPYTDWTKVNSDGFGDPGNSMAQSMVIFNGELHVGTQNGNGCQVWKTAATGGPPYTDWTKVNGDGFGTNQNYEATSMAVYGAVLYVGTWNGTTGCEVWSSNGTGGPPYSDWSQVNASGFGSGDDIPQAYSMSVYGTDLYTSAGVEVWKYNGSSWAMVNIYGFTTNINMNVSCMTEFNGDFYAATYSGLGCGVWRYDGSSWAQVNSDGFGDRGNIYARSMCVYGGYLYVGTFQQDACEVWRTGGVGGPPYTDWVQVNADGFGDLNNHSAHSMATYGGELYVGTYKWPDSTCEVWKTAASGGPPYTDWVQVNADGFGDASNWGAYSLLSFNHDATDYLYVGVGNNSTGVEIWRTAAAGGPPYSDWTQVNNDGWGGVANRYPYAMVEYDGKMYVGTGLNSLVFQTAGAGGPPYTDWTAVNASDFGDVFNNGTYSLAVFDDLLYAGTYNTNSGCEVWRYNGSGWTQANTDGFGNVNNYSAEAMHGYGSRLLVGTFNQEEGCDVWAAEVPSIVSATPVHGKLGENLEVDIVGNLTNFDGTSTASFGPEITVNSTTFVNATHVTANITIPGNTVAPVGSWDVNVTTGAETPVPLSGGFTVDPEPTITSVDPVVGDTGTDVTITGYGFGNVRNTSYVSFGSVQASEYSAWDWQSVTCKVPDGAVGITDVSLTTWFGGTSNAEQFTVTPGIDEIDPTSGYRGEVVTIDGSGFGDTRGTSSVKFGSQACGSTDYVSWSSGRVRAKVPAGATTGQVKVTTSGGMSNGVNFTVLEVPRIYSIVPSVVSPGAQVEIRGIGFGDTGGAGPRSGLGAESYVAFGGSRVTEYSLWSDTKIKCTVPADATSCDVVVVTGWGSSDPKEVTVVYPTWYLAEGTTAWGFSTYVSIVNPNDSAVTVDLIFMPTGETNQVQTISMPANSRATVNPADTLGARDFSTKVSCRDGETIAADRTMSWTGPTSSTPECHCSVGVTSPEETWYLPEGSTNWGFETWLLIQNPNGTEAHCTVTYMIEGQGPTDVSHEVPPNSRATFNMAEDIGNKDASIKVTSDQDVIPERAMYRNDRREGHDSIGTTSPAADYYLAEGTTAWGFTTYVLVQNPNPTDIAVNVTYMTGTGPVPHPENPITMPANSRKTIRVNDYLPDRDFSTRVSGSAPVIAERAMYWDAGTGEACHDSIGMSSPHMTFYLPDGEAGPEVETWTLVQNPNGTDVTVTITYMTPDGTGNVTKIETIPANSRSTFGMASHSGLTGRASIVVQAPEGGRPIMVERAMYWNSRGAGTDTIGGYGD
ncbi:MAG: IPT/TIG domain-containing protein [Actinobacteria bacterium]|nr:IPT/TIG domain-containing protein [Actinomycetota bacterium]MBU1945053.1 IPT/TIG domain-containing protein [Actinomycetota bacterium]MBU2686611.1 IPT/TIG domain-containing protein [Actinomycetota bacterium]